jgi:uncharacterized membrane protein
MRAPWSSLTLSIWGACSMYFMAHIYKDKYMVQDFMSLLKENKMMSIHFMVLKMEACTSVVNQDQAFEAGFSNEG